MSDIPTFTSDGTRSTKYERILAVRSDALPDSFRRNSLKESLVLQYVEHFEKQFVQLFPDRAPLLLCPLNEAGVPKFVPTTIRPTQLPFRELYDVGACAAFFAAYLHYEPLDNPMSVPIYLPSPSFTLQTRVGDAFDLATVLASYLIGSGYDAYVVSGRAPRWITLRMEDNSLCEWKPPDDAVEREHHTSPEALNAGMPSQVESSSDPAGASRYRLPAPPSLESEFAQISSLGSSLTARAVAARATASSGSGEPTSKAVSAQSAPLHEQQQHHVHAWVLVRAGQRDWPNHAFVEPSTGAIFPVTSSPYVAVESLWNHNNYYVNMQNQPLIPKQEATHTMTGPEVTNSVNGGHAGGQSTRGAIAERAAATVADLLASALAPELISPYSSLVGAALGTGATIAAGSSNTATGARGRLGAATAGSGGVTRRDTSARARSRGRTTVAWRDDLDAQRRGLQAGVASALASQSVKSVSELSFDLSVEQDWEYVMMPQPAVDERVLREDGGNGSGFFPGLPRHGGEGRAGGGKDARGDGGHDDLGAAISGARVNAGGTSTSKSSVGPAGVTVGGRDFGVELDGEHVLDLPQSWCPRLALDRYVAKVALGGSDSRTVCYLRARLETFIPHTHTTGLVARYSVYSDVDRTVIDCVTEVFSRRKDGLFKRVRCVPQCIVEEHFEKGRASGLALVVEELGLRRDLYFYGGSRIDGLLKRVHVAGEKITEYYGPNTPNRLWYRSVSLVPGSEVESAGVNAGRSKGVSAATADATLVRAAAHAVTNSVTVLPIRSTLTVDIDSGHEASIRKMTEKYRRDPSVPPHLDIAKAVYLLDEKQIQVTLQHAPGRITVTSRVYQKPSGHMEPLTVDPYAPEPRPFDLDAEYRRLILMEKDCHNAVRGLAKTIFQMLDARSAAARGHVELERTIFEIASDRARTGAPLEEEADKNQDDDDKETDYLLPFLLSAKDPANLTEKEARKADRECRTSFKERLLERVAIIQRRLDDENEKLLRKQQAFSRTRDHAEGAEEDFERYCAEATFRIGILEQRLERQEALVTRKYQDLERRLQSDPRLAVIYATVASATSPQRVTRK